MPVFRPVWNLFACACLALVSIASFAGTTGAAQPALSGWAATHTKAHTLAYAVATDVGAMAATDTLHIAVTLQLRNTSALDALTNSLASNPAAQVLTAQQFMDRHAPTLEQATRVANYLRAQGFQNVTIAANRLLVSADGTPAQAKAAFQAELHAFVVGSRRAYANVTDANVPSTLADTVLAVVGLQTVHMAHTNNAPRRAAGGTGAGLAATGRGGLEPAALPEHLRRQRHGVGLDRHHRDHHRRQHDADRHRPEDVRRQCRLSGAAGERDHRRQRQHRHLGHRRVEHGHPDLPGRGRRHGAWDAALYRDLAQ